MGQITFRLITVTAATALLIGQATKSQAADDIVDTAVQAGSFKTLATALQAADLVDALKGEGPFTVFAPTDEAFAKLPQGTVETLQGQFVHVSVSDGKAKVNKANLVVTDIDASNGVIHVIDAVLLPPEKKVSAAGARQMIHTAVARGSRLYNNGHHSRCAELYMATIREMMEYRDELPVPIMTRLTSALSKAENTHCPTQQSWTLRRGLDRAYYAMDVQ